MTVAKRGTAWRLSAIALVSVFALTACLGGAAKTPEINITAPTAGTALSVGQSVAIVGTATGDAISRVEIIVDGQRYAELNAPDLTKGVPSFPINVPWTPLAAGTHAIQLKAYGPPDGKALLTQSEPLVLNAQAAAVSVVATEPAPTQEVVPTKAPSAPDANAAVPTVAPPAQPGAAVATTAPAAGAAGNTAPSLTVTNEFVNVRTGPDTAYDRIGELKQGQTAPVKGKSADGQWWQISFPSGAGGIGWVINDYVQANGLAANVPVASAPPKPVVVAPVVPAAPAAPAPVLVPLVTAAPPQVAPAAPGALVGGRGILRINANPVGSGSTAYASWNIPNFKEGQFDRGDGQGLKGPIAQSMQVDVPGISGARTIKLQWTDTNGAVNEDTIVVNVSGQGVAQPVPVQNNPDCTATNPEWRGGNSGEYAFCTRRDMTYVGTDPGNIAYYRAGEDVTLKLNWDIYGINGLFFMMEASDARCGPGGDKGFQRTATGSGEVAFNIRDMGTGGYKMSMKVIRKDNVEVRYNEKFLCVGVGQASGGNPQPTAPPSSGGGGGGGQPTAMP